MVEKKKIIYTILYNNYRENKVWRKSTLNWNSEKYGQEKPFLGEKMQEKFAQDLH